MVAIIDAVHCLRVHSHMTIVLLETDERPIIITTTTATTTTTAAATTMLSISGS